MFIEADIDSLLYSRFARFFFSFFLSCEGLDPFYLENKSDQTFITNPPYLGQNVILKAENKESVSSC